MDWDCSEKQQEIFSDKDISDRFPKTKSGAVKSIAENIYKKKHFLY